MATLLVHSAQKFRGGRANWVKGICQTLPLLFHSLFRIPTAVSPFSFSGWSGSASALDDTCVLVVHSLEISSSICAGSASASEFFRPWKYGDYSRFCSLIPVGAAYRGSQLADTDLAMARSTSSTQAPGPLKRPLVTLPPRGDGGKHGSSGFDERSASPRERLLISVVSP